MAEKIKIENNILRLRIGQYVSLVICLMLMLVVPIWRDRKIFGMDLGGKDGEKVETIKEMKDGSLIINTTEIGKDIMGYGGPTPLEIYIKDDIIQKVVPLKNQETPEFYGAVRNSDLLESYDGKSLEQASQTPLDGVSGATYTSRAIIENMRAGVAYALDSNIEKFQKDKTSEKISLKFYITIIVIVAGGVIPLLLKDRRYRTLQLILNVLLLGFWGGTFISYSLMVSFLTNGITRVVLIPVALMLIAAFIYPMFGKKNYYCAWLCPYGSLQELLGKFVKYKFKLKPGLLQGLMIFREILWFVLMWLLWTGLWFDWMGYEPFAAFFFTDASAVTLSIAGGFLILSLFIQRPYCRFVCPTGSLFKFSEGSR